MVVRGFPGCCRTAWPSSSPPHLVSDGLCRRKHFNQEKTLTHSPPTALCGPEFGACSRVRCCGRPQCRGVPVLLPPQPSRSSHVWGAAEVLCERLCGVQACRAALGGFWGQAKFWRFVFVFSAPCSRGQSRVLVPLVAVCAAFFFFFFFYFTKATE